MPAIGYLFAGAPDDLVLHEEPARALLPTPYAYVLHAGGLAARVATPGLTGLLPLASWPIDVVRDLQERAPDIAGAISTGIARGTAPPPLSLGRATHCYTVARDPRHPLRAAVGAYYPGMDPPAPYSYIVAANGLFVWTRTAAFEAFVPIAAYPAGTVWGLDELSPSARLLIPRAPAAFFAHFVEEAREEARRTGHEVLWQLCWRTGEWVIVKPEQVGTPGSVDYDPNQILEDGVIKLHSHGRFGAFWSATDNSDERHAEFNIIVGDLRSRTEPSALCRVGVYGRTLATSLSTVIDGDLPVRDRHGDPPPVGDSRRTLWPAPSVDETADATYGRASDPSPDDASDTRTDRAREEVAPGAAGAVAVCVAGLLSDVLTRVAEDLACRAGLSAPAQDGRLSRGPDAERDSPTGGSD
jgi:PRTRC genetic system protein A